jgi:hypothetical protein
MNRSEEKSLDMKILFWIMSWIVLFALHLYLPPNDDHVINNKPRVVADSMMVNKMDEKYLLKISNN